MIYYFEIGRLINQLSSYVGLIIRYAYHILSSNDLVVFLYVAGYSPSSWMRLEKMYDELYLYCFEFSFRILIFQTSINTYKLQV